MICNGLNLRRASWTARNQLVGVALDNFVFSITCDLHCVSSHRPFCYPYERCPACQGGNPKLEWPVDSHPKPLPLNPKRRYLQPETPAPATRNFRPLNPKLSPLQLETLT